MLFKIDGCAEQHGSFVVAQSRQSKDTCGRNTCGSTARAPGKDKGEKTKTTKYGKVKNNLLII